MSLIDKVSWAATLPRLLGSQISLPYIGITTVFFIFPFILWSLAQVVGVVNDARATTIQVTIIGSYTCNDTIDNDGDSLVDYPADTGCESTTDTDEYNAPPPSGGGGGGGGGGSGSGFTLPTGVIFRGKAYPGSYVALLKDSQSVAVSKAGPDANFEIALTGLSGGVYSFSIWSADANNLRSTNQTFSVTITSGVTTVISGIFIPPTIAVDKSEVKHGDVITFFGASAPSAGITLIVNSEPEIMKNTTAGSDGLWSHQFDTLALTKGAHSGKSRANKDGLITDFSASVGFIVGVENVIAEPPKDITKGEVNNDGRVNIVDFSIAAYWFGRPNPPTNVDLNKDGKLNLVDFSIMAFYWTG